MASTNAPAPNTCVNAVELADDLLRRVVRAFHSDEHVVILDALLRRKIMCQEAEVVQWLQISPRIVRRALFDLRESKLVVSQEVKAEQPVDPTAPPTRTVHQRQKILWTVDYKKAVDVIKYRVHKLLSGGVDPASKMLAYECPKCGNKYTLQEVVGWVDSTGQLRCENGFPKCRTVLTDIPLDQADASAQIRQKFGEQLKPITDILKRLSQVTAGVQNPFPEFLRPAMSLAIPGATGSSNAPLSHNRAILQAASAGSQLGVVVELTQDDKKEAAPPPSKKQVVPWLTRDSEPVSPKDPSSVVSPTMPAISPSPLIPSPGTTPSLSPITPQLDSSLSPPQPATTSTPMTAPAGTIKKISFTFTKKPPRGQWKDPEPEKEATPVETKETFDAAPPTQQIQVSVRGKPKAILDVTEEDKAMMTAEEYKVYGEQYMTLMGFDE